MKWKRPGARKPVIQFKEEDIQRFDSALAAEEETGVDQGNISACCNGKRLSAGGFKWRFSN
jgi:hypothetical protein